MWPGIDGDKSIVCLDCMLLGSRYGHSSNANRRSRLTDEPLRVALLTYKGNPFCGGQGVYVRHLSRELLRLGHRVEVIGSQPYPVLDEGYPALTLTELP